MNSSLAQSLYGSWTPTKSGAQRAAILDGRYVIREQLSRRGQVSRYLAWDESNGGRVPVQLVRAPLDEREASDGSVWPSLAWEERVRERCQHSGMPRIVGRVTSECARYLILEIPEGPHLWDAWDDAGVTIGDKFGWLIQLADLLYELHQAGAILEGLRPDQVILTEDGRVVLQDNGGLVPFPLPAGAPITATRTTAPELLSDGWVDARADLYHFGALMYALIVGRELVETDFTPDGRPKPCLERFPEIHPLLGRLLAKTFATDRNRRFPTPEAAATDSAGCLELIATLEQCQAVLGRAHLDVASWSTIGMARSGNEDTFALLHTAAGTGDSPGEHALVIVADGMGGSAAGEVAAAIATRLIYQEMVALPPFGSFPITEEDQTTPAARLRAEIVTALKHANRAVHVAAQESTARRGMGCTAEVVYTDGQHLIVGHVGDSRTYRFRRGRLALLTRDHTYVARLVEFGEITPEEAEAHPRRAELQQALGGWAEVEPDVVDVPLEPGDWVVVCSDGLSNAVKAPMMQQVLEKATSADDACRRVVNFANHLGASDNVTVAVIRAV
ncbi:MAG: protein phosphatase 2C domain-containing protein [Gemmataceae bacterium]